MKLDDTQRAAQEQFAKQSARYGSTHILADVEDVEAAVDRLALPDVADVLDVACGAGHTGLFLAGRGHRVALADITLPMLEQVRATAAERGLEVETRQHPAESVPYEDASFDLVTCRVAPHHFSDPRAFVGEAARVLRHGGWFLVIDGSVEDDEPVAAEWMHEVERLRDPSHGRFLAPGAWRALCDANALTVEHCELQPMKQPDLDWYFETAATPAENRRKVLELVQNAPEEARRVFRIGEEEGRIVWWWRRLTLIARKS